MFSSFVDVQNPYLVCLLGESASGRDRPRWEPGPGYFRMRVVPAARAVWRALGSSPKCLSTESRTSRPSRNALVRVEVSGEKSGETRLRQILCCGWTPQVKFRTFWLPIHWKESHLLQYTSPFLHVHFLLHPAQSNPGHIPNTWTLGCQIFLFLEWKHHVAWKQLQLWS